VIGQGVGRAVAVTQSAMSPCAHLITALPDGPQHEVSTPSQRALPLITICRQIKRPVTPGCWCALVRLGDAVKEDDSLGLPVSLTDTDLALWIGAKRRSRRGPAGLAIAGAAKV
jgi:hypothetical protein